MIKKLFVDFRKRFNQKTLMRKRKLNYYFMTKFLCDLMQPGAVNDNTIIINIFL